MQELELEADIAHSEATQRNRMENGRAILRDALSYERPIRIAGGDSISDARMHDHSTVEADDTSHFTGIDDRALPPPSYMPTPPYTSSQHRQSRSPRPVEVPSVTTPSLTPRFAPAYGLNREDDGTSYRVRSEMLAQLTRRMSEMTDPGERNFIAGHRAEINRMRSRSHAESSREQCNAEIAYLDSVNTGLAVMRDSELSELPPLRRMTRSLQGYVRDPHGRSQRNLDGLGDRERSFSPDDDHWETMLTTVSWLSWNILLHIVLDRFARKS